MTTDAELNRATDLAERLSVENQRLRDGETVARSIGFTSGALAMRRSAAAIARYAGQTALAQSIEKVAPEDLETRQWQ